MIGLRASIELFNHLGIAAVSQQLLRLRHHLLDRLCPHGWHSIHQDAEFAAGASQWQSGILSLGHPSRDLQADFDRLKAKGILASLRQDRHGCLASPQPTCLSTA